MSVLVCGRKYGGCGYIGHGHEWRSTGQSLPEAPEMCDDTALCPKCGEDHAFQVLEATLDEMLGDDPKSFQCAQELLAKERREQEEVSGLSLGELVQRMYHH